MIDLTDGEKEAILADIPQHLDLNMALGLLIKGVFDLTLSDKGQEIRNQLLKGREVE